MINKNILILGGTGFIGKIFTSILEKKNKITLVGSSGDINFLIGESISGALKELIKINDVIIFASWNFVLKKHEYTSKHIGSVNEILILCKKYQKKLLFVSTSLARENSKSIYNKTKYLCEKEVLLFNQSIIRLGVIYSELNLKGNIYLKLSKIPSFLGYKILLKPNNKKFYIDTFEGIGEFFKNFSFKTSNTYENNSAPVELTQIIDMFNKKKNKYIFFNWKFVYFILKSLSVLGIKFRINTDSLMSIWGDN